MKKKISCMLLAFAMMLAAVPLLELPAFAAGSVNLQTSVAKNNGQVVVTISVNEKLDADVLSFNMKYDDYALELLGTEKQPCTYACQYDFGETAASPYKCSWTNLEKSDDSDQAEVDIKKPYQGDLFKFVFAIKNGAKAKTYNFAFDDVECAVLDIKTDENNKTVAEEKSLAVNIEETSIDLATYGDIDGNMAVDLADALYLKRCLAGWEGYSIINRTVADLNSDSNVTIEDVTILERHIAGWSGYDSLPKSGLNQ